MNETVSAQPADPQQFDVAIEGQIPVVGPLRPSPGDLNLIALGADGAASCLGDVCRLPGGVSDAG